jgi:hypothetical protein
MDQRRQLWTKTHIVESIAVKLSSKAIILSGDSIARTCGFTKCYKSFDRRIISDNDRLILSWLNDLYNCSITVSPAFMNMNILTDVTQKTKRTVIPTRF